MLLKRTMIGALAVVLLLSALLAVAVSAGAQTTPTPEEGIVSLSMSINADIQNNYAVTTVSQTLHNYESTDQEAAFTFTIPSTAFLSQFKLEINGTTFVSRVVEKNAAQEEYDAAKDSGKTASIVGATGPSLETFDYKVNLKAGQELAYHLSYEQYIPRYKGNYTYSVPLTRNQIPETGDFGIYVNIESVAGFKEIITPGVADSGIENLLGTKGSVTWIPGDRNFVEDFEVVYTINEYPVEGYMMNYVMGDQGYFFHVFCPTIDDLGGEALGKDIVFVIDKSGSMSGEKMTQTKDAFKGIVDDLQPKDRFNVVMFSDQLENWKGSLQTANKENIDSAKTYISEIDPSGATNINGALTRGLSLLDTETANVPIICFLTDGVPTAGETNSGSIRENVKTANTMGAAVFCLAFGNDCDMDLLSKISMENNAYATQILEGKDASDQIIGYYDTFSTPLVTDIYMDYGENTWDVFPTYVSSLFQGSEVVVVGRYDPDETDYLYADVKGDTSEGETDFSQNYTLPIRTDQDFIPRYWASQKIRDLNDQMLIEGQTWELKENITDLAVEYQFVTQFTSMILVVEKDPEGTNTNQGNTWDDPERRDDDYTQPDSGSEYEPPMDADDGWGYDDDDDDDDYAMSGDEDSKGIDEGAMSAVGGLGLLILAVLAVVAVVGIIIIVVVVLMVKTKTPKPGEDLPIAGEVPKDAKRPPQGKKTAPRKGKRSSEKPKKKSGGKKKD